MLVFVLLIFTDSVAQEADSTLNLEELDLSELEEMDIESDLEEMIKFSKGYFPSALGWNLNLDFFYAPGDNYDVADDIEPYGFVKTAFPYSGSNPLKPKGRTIMKENEKDLEEDRYPMTSFESLGLRLQLTLPLPLIFNFGFSLDFSDGLLFSLDKTKQFLSRDGELKDLKEAGIVYHEELLLSSRMGFKVPIYGAFFETDDEKVSSIYFLYLGGTGSFVLDHNTTQYLQIANYKNELRYPNGRDTVRLISEKEISGMECRNYLDVGLGWQTEVNKIGLGLEIMYSYPLKSVLHNTDWYQHRIQVSMVLKFLGFFYL